MKPQINNSMKMSSKTKYIAPIGIALVALFFIASYIIGNVVVKRSEKEFSASEQKGEAEASKYSLQEIDAQTGQLRWELTAKEGTTKNSLDSAVIKTISAKVYKDTEVVFELKAPYGKANSSKKEVFLYGGVTTQNKDKTFLLHSNELELGMGASIHARKGFNLVIKNKGKLSGDSAVVNDDQSEINVINLNEAKLQDIALEGNNVYIKRNQEGEIIKALIKNGGKVILKKHKNDSLTANIIEWIKDGSVEAKDNVIYKSKDITFKSNHLLLNPDGKITASDHVEIVHGKTQCFGDQLTYDDNSFIVIQGNPKAIQDGKQITADKILYNLNTEKVEAIGNVQTIITSNENV